MPTNQEIADAIDALNPQQLYHYNKTSNNKYYSDSSGELSDPMKQEAEDAASDINAKSNADASTIVGLAVTKIIDRPC